MAALIIVGFIIWYAARNEWLSALENAINEQHEKVKP